MDEAQYKKNSMLIEVLDIIRIVLITFIIVFLCTICIFKVIRVEGNSMYPTLKDGDFGFSSIVTTYFTEYERFDVVIVSGEQTDGDNWVKRIIGLPGETIEYKDDVLYIDGEAIEEPFLDEEYMLTITGGISSFTSDFGPVTLGEDEYFVMGDNRRVSYDSREVGAFTSDEIVAKSFLIVYPFEDFGIVNSES